MADLHLALAAAYELLRTGRKPLKEHHTRFWEAVKRGLEKVLGSSPLPQDSREFYELLKGPLGPQAEASIRHELAVQNIDVGEEARCEWLILGVLPLVKGAINELHEWLESSVAEFPDIEEGDWWGYALAIAVMLVQGKCRCSRANCAREHDLSQWNPQERTLGSFIYRAIIGPPRKKEKSR